MTKKELREAIIKDTHEWIRDCGLDVQDVEAFIDRDTLDKVDSYTEALVERRELEARRDELKCKMDLHIDFLSSQDYKDGFSAALNQIDAITDERIAVIEGRLGGLASPGTPTAGGNQVDTLSAESAPEEV